MIVRESQVYMYSYLKYTNIGLNVLLGDFGRLFCLFTHMHDVMHFYEGDLETFMTEKVVFRLDFGILSYHTL